MGRGLNETVEAIEAIELGALGQDVPGLLRGLRARMERTRSEIWRGMFHAGRWTLVDWLVCHRPPVEGLLGEAARLHRVHTGLARLEKKIHRRLWWELFWRQGCQDERPILVAGPGDTWGWQNEGPRIRGERPVDPGAHYVRRSVIAGGPLWEDPTAVALLEKAQWATVSIEWLARQMDYLALVRRLQGHGTPTTVIWRGTHYTLGWRTTLKGNLAPAIFDAHPFSGVVLE